MRFVARGELYRFGSLMGDGVLLSDPPKGRTFNWHLERFHVRLPHVHYTVSHTEYSSGFQSKQLCVFGSRHPPRSLDDPVFALPLPNVFTDGFACLGGLTWGDDEPGVIRAMLDQFFVGEGCKFFISGEVMHLVGASDPPDFFRELSRRTPAIWDEFPHDLRLNTHFRVKP